MARDWMFDAVLAEVAYRTDELNKAGRSAWIGRIRRAARRAGVPAAVAVPRQRDGSHEALHRESVR